MVARIVYGKVAERPGDASTGTDAGSADEDGLVFLNSVTATGSSVVSSGSFASVASDYLAIVGRVSGLKTATVSIVGIRTSSDGSNYSATTAAYTQLGHHITATQAVDQNLNSTGTDVIAITRINSAVGFLATLGGACLNAEFILSNLNPTSTGHFPMVTVNAAWRAENDTAGSNVVGKRTAAVAQGGIQFVNIGGGNFIDGRLDIFGLLR